MSITLTSAETSSRDWNYQFEIDDEETGEPIDLTGAVISIGIFDQNGCQRITATMDNGKLSIDGLGIVSMRIPYSETNLCAGTYDIGGYLQINGETLDLIEGSIAVRTGRPKP
jgi:hypothetical protein